MESVSVSSKKSKKKYARHQQQANMASAIELVDRADQEMGAAGARFEHIPNRTGDLFLKIEREEEDDASSIATTDDYIGLELDVQLERRDRKRRRMTLSVIFMFLMLTVGAILYVQQRSSASQSGQPSNSSSHAQPNATTPAPAPATPDQVDEADTIALWPTAAPLPYFARCPPPLKNSHGLAVFHMYDVRIVPESPAKDDYENQWSYTFSALDIDEQASIIAVGMSDFSAGTEAEVGLVRVFAHDCSKNEWKQLGQDLLGTNDDDQFGHAVSSSKDGTVMAIGAPQEQYEGGNGFVQVYFLNETRWDTLGSRIEDLEATSGYSLLGHAINLSDKGETLAVLAVTDTNKFVIRVFQYDYIKQDWFRKGHDLQIEVDYADGYEFKPDITLSEAGDTLTMADPQIGVVVYQFHFASNKWAQTVTKKPQWEEDDWWIESVDVDEAGDLIAFSAFEQSSTDDTNLTWAAKVVDFSTENATEVYSQLFEDFNVDIYVAVSKDGQTAAIVGSRDDYDDDTSSYGDEQFIGAMTIIHKNINGNWKVVGKGTQSENIGVPGWLVSLSGDGRLAVVGSDEVISLYGIHNNTSTDDSSTTNTTNSTQDQPASTASNFTICAPFPNATTNTHAGDIDSLPKMNHEHTLSVAMSKNGSIVAVGIDQYSGENRGLVRVFGWNCANYSYSQLGQDLFGSDDYDGFGQSVDLSSDGTILAVGANQPPPGKSGYVEVYQFSTDQEWKLVGHRLDNVKDTVEDVGREVRISDDGSVVAFSGSIIEEDADGWHETSSFVRIMKNVDGEWKAKGDDLEASVGYDEYGAEVHIAIAGDGATLGVTGSYSTFMAKLYSFDSDKKNWTELVVPPIKDSDDDDIDYEYDYDFENFFSGRDIALNDDGTYLAIAGTKYSDDQDFAVVRVLKKDEATGNYTLSQDPVDFEEDWASSAVGISGDGNKLAVGLNGHTDSANEQGALFVTSADNSDTGWASLGKIDGRSEQDLFGARVSISRDGTLAAASSRKGYVSFFKIG